MNEIQVSQMKEVLGQEAPKNADLIEWLKRVVYYRNEAKKQNVSLVEYGTKELAKYAGLKMGVPIPLGYGFSVVCNLKFQPEALADNKTQMADIRWLMQNGGALTGKFYHSSMVKELGSTIITFGVNSTVTFVKLEASQQTFEKVLARIGALSKFISMGGIAYSFLINLLWGNMFNLTSVYAWHDMGNAVQNLKVEKRRYMEFKSRERNLLVKAKDRVQDAGVSAVATTAETMTLGLVKSGNVKEKMYGYDKKQIK